MCPAPILKVQRQLPIENQEATCLTATIQVISKAPTPAPLPQQTPGSFAGPSIWSRQVRASCTLPPSHGHWKSSFSSPSSGLGHFQRALWAPSGGGLTTLPAETAVDQNGLTVRPGSSGGRDKLSACLLYLVPPLSSRHMGDGDGDSSSGLSGGKVLYGQGRVKKQGLTCGWRLLQVSPGEEQRGSRSSGSQDSPHCISGAGQAPGIALFPEFLPLCQSEGQPFLRIRPSFREGLGWEGGVEAGRTVHLGMTSPQALKSEDLMSITVLSTQ